MATGDLSPVELARACLERTRALDDTLKCFVTIDEDDVLTQANTRADEIKRRGPRGPLDGVPIAIKDLIDVAGLPTRAGSRVLAGNIADSDAPVVTALRRAGAVIFGKTNTHEFALGVVTPPTCNPWDPERIPGGSSGGSAAAVAALMCPGALGTDTAGSIRIPAALCGITGLKPRPDIVSLQGVIPLSWSYDACGPLARSAEDAGLFWSALTGDSASATDLRSLRVAVPRAFHEVVDIDADVERSVTESVEALLSEGARRVTVDLPPFEQWDSPRGVPLLVEMLVAHKEAGWYPEHQSEYAEDIRAALRYAEGLTAAKLLNAYRRLEPLKTAFIHALDDADVMLLPTTPVAAPTHAEAQVRDEGHRPPIARALTRINGPVNACRLAAINVPCGFTVTRLPVGMQFVGRNEQVVLGAALAYQRTTDFHTRRPPIMNATKTRPGSGLV